MVQLSSASPYGKGKYDENVPYGSETSLSIATSGNVSLSVTPTTSGTSASSSSTVTVTSTDVVGYKLYIRSLGSTDLNNLGATLPASANVSAGPLAINTWGYNTNGSTNYQGSSLTDTLIRSFTGPAPSGDITTVTYGIYVDLAKPAGVYTTSILYTAVPQTN